MLILLIVQNSLFLVLLIVGVIVHDRRKRKTAKNGRSSSRLLATVESVIPVSSEVAVQLVSEIEGSVLRDLEVDSTRGRIQGVTKVSQRSWGTVVVTELVAQEAAHCRVVIHAWPRIETTIRDGGESKRKAASVMRLIQARTDPSGGIGLLTLDERRESLSGILRDFDKSFPLAELEFHEWIEGMRELIRYGNRLALDELISGLTPELDSYRVPPFRLAEPALDASRLNALALEREAFRDRALALAIALRESQTEAVQRRTAKRSGA